MEERITTAGVFISNGRVLVAKRSKGGSIAGKYEFPGGKNRWGESIADTLRREYMEELGVSIEVGDEILSFDFTNKDTLYHQKVCLIDIKDQSFTLNFHTEARMVGKAELETLDFAETDRKIASFIVEKKLL